MGENNFQHMSALESVFPNMHLKDLSVATSLSILLTGLALLLRRHTYRAISLAQMLSVVLLLISFVTLNRYLYGDASLQHAYFAVEALGFMTIGALIILSARRWEPFVSFTRNGNGARIGRRTMLALSIVTVAGGWLRITSEKSGLIEAGHATALVVASVMGMMIGVVWRTAAYIERAERARQSAESELRTLNEHLEKKVQERTALLNAAYEDLSTSEERYRFLFEANPLPLCVVDLDLGRFSAVNEAMVRQYGYTREEFLAMPIEQLYKSGDVQQLHAATRGMYHGHNGTFRSQHIRKDGTQIEVELHEQTVVIDGQRKCVALPLDITNRRRSHLALQQYNTRLHMLSQQLLHAQENERRRIATELHDQIGQTLTAAKLGLQGVRGMLGDKVLAERLDDNIHLAADVLKQVRSLSLDLRPPLLDELGLHVALDSHVKSLARRTGLSMVFESEGPRSRVRPETEIACFRLAQEALTNAMRHAQAKHVIVRLHTRGSELHLWVTDDGVGFDLEAVRRNETTASSLGLLSMAERATLANALFDIQSSVGGGTVVHAAFRIDSTSTQTV